MARKTRISGSQAAGMLASALSSALPRSLAGLSRGLLALRGLLVLGAILISGTLTTTRGAWAQTAGAFGDAPVAVSPPVRWEERFPESAALRIDVDQQRLLLQAERFAKEGRYDLAAALWQKVIDEAGQTLSATQFVEPTGPNTTPLVIYRPLAEHVEEKLGGLPPEGLAAYRTTADAEAKALFAAAASGAGEAGLQKLVRRYFLSSLGDDAAFRLAGLALDRHEFVAASHLLDKILARHPDPSVAKGEILIRQAVAAAHLHDRAAAEAALTDAAKASGPRVPAEAIAQVAAAVKQALAANSAAATSSGHDWLLALGTPGRNGQMSALPPSFTSRPLADAWSVEFALPGLPQPPRGAAIGDGALARSPAAGPAPAAKQSDAAAREELIGRWLAHGWRPTGSLRLEGERVYFRTAKRLVSYDTRGPGSTPLWQSAQASGFEPDALSRQLAMLAAAGDHANGQTTGRPQSPAEIQFFGDRVAMSLAVVEGVVYSLESSRAGQNDGAAAESHLLLQNAPPARSRRNRLTAYEAETGKALWTRGASDHVSEKKEALDAMSVNDAGFLAAPVPCDDLLLVPVSHGAALELLALDRGSGKTAWRSYLCEEPTSGAPPWAEPLVAVEGQEAYLATGCGVVFALDAADGSIRWAVRYARDVQPSTPKRNSYGESFWPLLGASGWDDDVVIPYGRLVVLLPSDSDRLLALDRRTGERVWESPRISPLGTVADYCLGVEGGGLFVGGKNVVRRYDLLTGRLDAETPIDDSLGRGCLTHDAVYLPTKNSIVRRDRSLKQTASASVVLSTDEPVGNLFSDGRRLWVYGAARVYTLESLDEQLAELSQAIAAGDSGAILKRMRILLKQGRQNLALDDLRSYFALLRRQHSASEAADRLLSAMNELKLPETEPAATLKLLSEILADAPPRQTTEPASLPLTRALVASITALRQRKPSEAIGAILHAAPLLNEDYLESAAAFAVNAIAKKEDVSRLMAALESDSAASQRIALAAAVRLAPELAARPLAELLAKGDDRVRLLAARALANLDQQQPVIPTLIELLSSDSVAVRTRSQQTLTALTGQHIPFAPEGTAADRAATVRAWRAWQAANPKAALKLPLADRAAAIGRTLLATPAGLIELDAEHRERWRLRLPGAAWGCQGLPNGHRLVAINSHSMVIEYDDSGNEVWRKDRLPAPPTTVERLEDGHTLVACGHSQQIVEIAPDGMILTIPVPGNPISAQRLDSGSTLVALDQTPRIVEIDRSGRVVWEAGTGDSAPRHAVRLASGNTLVTLGQGRRAIELDPAGRTIWQTHVPLTNPFAAERLPGGETLVADQLGVRAIDASGRQVLWHYRSPQVTSVSAF